MDLDFTYQDSLITDYINLFSTNISQQEVNSFRNILSSIHNKKGIMGFPEGVFSFNKKKKTFRLVKRNENAFCSAYGRLSKERIDFGIVVVMKIAKQEGFDIYFEDAISN